MSLKPVPVSFDEACKFVKRFHRHHRPPVGCKFCIGVADYAQNTEPGTQRALNGVAIVGRPVSRMLDDGWTLEVTRTCTDGTPNANSFLYGRCWQIAVNEGFRRLVTYTQDGESGATLRATGWAAPKNRSARSGWTTPSRPRVLRGTENVARFFWVKTTPDYNPDESLPLCPEVEDPAVQALFEVVA